MSENLVQVVGDTTTRELYEGGPTVSTGVSRKLSPENRNYSMLIYQQAKPPLDSEHNLAQQNQNYLRAQILRKILHMVSRTRQIAYASATQRCMRMAGC